jgi:hypothetical protein
MWTHENRAKYNRDHLRYPSDLTDDEWTRVEPFIPPAKRGGGKRRTDMRAAMNGVMYILSTGCLLPVPYFHVVFTVPACLYYLVMFGLIGM